MTIYILDSANKVESLLLEDYLRESLGIKPNTNGEYVIVQRLDHFSLDSLAVNFAPLLSSEENIMVKPLRVMWRRSLDNKGTELRFRDLLLGSSRRPSYLGAVYRRRRDPSSAIVVEGAQASLSSLKIRASERYGDSGFELKFPEFVASQASLSLDVAERKHFGSKYKIPRRVKDNVLENAVSKLHGSGTRDSGIEQKLSDYVEELVCRPKPFWIDTLALFFRYLTKLSYQGKVVVDDGEFERLRKQCTEKATCIVYPHKSHMDAVTMSSLFYQYDLPTPHILGGINMAFSGLRFIGKRSSMIFIRRDIKDDPHYKLCLREYMSFLVKNRFPLHWCFEGTRSRTGKLMPPKYGLFKYAIEGMKGSPDGSLSFVPISITYDLIEEVSTYAREEAGKKKQAESLVWVLGYIRRLKQPKGRIYVNVAEPIHLNKIPEGDIEIQKVAFHVGSEVNRITPITLVSIVMLIFLQNAPRALTRSEFQALILNFIDYLSNRKIRLTSDFDPTKPEQAVNLIRLMIDQGLIERYSGGLEQVYMISPSKYVNAAFYRNMAANHFLARSVGELAMLIVAGTDSDDPALSLFWQEVDFLRSLFKFEFFYSPREEFYSEVDSELQSIKADWQEDLDKNRVTSREIIHLMKPRVARGTLMNIVEAYYIASEVVCKKSEGKTVSLKEFTEQCLRYGKQALMQRRVSSEAAIGVHLFKSAYSYFSSNGLMEEGDKNFEKRRKQIRARLFSIITLLVSH